MEQRQKSLWELLWDYDPNGLVVVDQDLNVRLVNPAFCRMFRMRPDEIVGRPVSVAVGEDVADFREVRGTEEVIVGKEQAYPRHDLYVRKVVFAIKDEGIVACIMVDMTRQWQQRQEIVKLRRETIAKAHEVLSNQMKVAQEIAGLLGETTAETKVSLMRLIDTFDEETV